MQYLKNSCPVAHSVRAIFLAGGLFGIFLSAMSGSAMTASLYEELVADERLTLFAGAMEQAGMSGILKQEGPYILFVPSDQAMSNEGSAFLLNGVLLTPSNAGRLKDLVSYHIVPTEQLTEDGADDESLPTMMGVPVHMARFGKARVINGWAVVTERKEADNGVLYIVDRLLLPTSPDLN